MGLSRLEGDETKPCSVPSLLRGNYCEWPMRYGRVRLAIVLAGLLAFVLSAQSLSPADRAFKKIQSLVGEWEGKDDHGMAVKTNLRVIAANTAVMETLSMHQAEEMVTLYSLDGEAISLIHYCPTKNQPHMQAAPPPDPIHELVFEFKDARNLPSLATGHEQKLVLRFEDADHITETWTWRRDGRDTPSTFHFARKKTNSTPGE